MKQKKHNQTPVRTGAPVRVHIRSQIRDLTPDDDAPTPFGGLRQFDFDHDFEPETIEYKTDGLLSDDGDTVTISYDESEELGFEKSSTTLSFSKGTPGAVIMVRSGDGSTVCRFSETERRQHCVYNTGFLPIELIINTFAVENSFAGGAGHIALDYSIELRGLTTERNKLSVDYKPLDNRPTEIERSSL